MPTANQPYTTYTSLWSPEPHYSTLQYGKGPHRPSHKATQAIHLLPMQEKQVPTLIFYFPVVSLL